MLRLSSLLLVGFLSAAAAAQTCSTLTITGSLTPGSSVSIAVSGSLPNAVTFIAVSQSQGSTTIGLGALGSLTLDLASPFAYAPIGFTGSAGSLALRPLNIPPTTPALTSPLNVQAISLQLSLSFPPMLLTCKSNAVTL